jgi:hypothetical protein
VVLEKLGQLEQGTSGGKARITELVGDGRVHVHNERDPQQTGERGDEVGGLLHGVNGVGPREDETEHGLDEERDVEEHLGEGGSGLHVAHGESEAAVVNEAGNVDARPLGKAQQIHLVTQLGEGTDHGKDVERGSPHFEKGLGCEEEDLHC